MKNKAKIIFFFPFLFQIQYKFLLEIIILSFKWYGSSVPGEEVYFLYLDEKK
jgi:hypothetical protein